MAIGILATGSFLPDHVVTNDDLAQVVQTSDAWVTARTGIRERRRADPRHHSSDLGHRAALAALDDGGLAPDQLDALVVATSSPDQIQPSTAC
ncbi:ketoacyl-ACP synthase III, partial [Streptomyces sp. TRM76130]|nr:ketoacyl-ACP synthase III [Streptomyces sp. TRM76130]